MLHGLIAVNFAAVAIILYVMVVCCVHAYVKGELFIYENHSTKRHNFTPKVKRKLKIILVLSFIPGLQLLLVFWGLWQGLKALGRFAMVRLNDTVVMYRKLTEGKP
jgi:hypothetical protein